MNKLEKQNRKFKSLKVMKPLFLITILISLFATSSIQAQEKVKLKKKKVEVRGNCGMCKNTIEKAAMSVEGVEEARWDQEQELLTVRFDPNSTDLEHIEKAISATGYDTKNTVAPQEVYENLHACCVYEGKKKEK